MNLNYNEMDTPLFHDDATDGEKLSGDVLASRDVETLERLVEARSKDSETNRMNSAHIFSIILLGVVLAGLCAIMGIEYFVEIENEYVSELFEFFKYVATTLIGYLFATHKNDK